MVMDIGSDGDTRELNSVDFEADLSVSIMCTEVRRCMALDFPEGFGPDIAQEPRKELQDMNSEEYENTSLVRSPFWSFCT